MYHQNVSTKFLIETSHKNVSFTPLLGVNDDDGGEAATAGRVLPYKVGVPAAAGLGLVKEVTEI